MVGTAGFSDLKSEDKQKLGNLVMELAKATEQNVSLTAKLQEEKGTFENRLERLKQENVNLMQDAAETRQKFLESLDMLKTYQKKLASISIPDEQYPSIPVPASSSSPGGMVVEPAEYDDDNDIAAQQTRLMQLDKKIKTMVHESTVMAEDVQPQQGHQGKAPSNDNIRERRGRNVLEDYTSSEDERDVILTKATQTPPKAQSKTAIHKKSPIKRFDSEDEIEQSRTRIVKERRPVRDVDDEDDEIEHSRSIVNRDRKHVRAPVVGTGDDEIEHSRTRPSREARTIRRPQPEADDEDTIRKRLENAKKHLMSSKAALKSETVRDNPKERSRTSVRRREQSSSVVSESEDDDNFPDYVNLKATHVKTISTQTPKKETRTVSKTSTASGTISAASGKTSAASGTISAASEHIMVTLRPDRQQSINVQGKKYISAELMPIIIPVSPQRATVNRATNDEYDDDEYDDEYLPENDDDDDEDSILEYASDDNERSDGDDDDSSDDSDVEQHIDAEQYYDDDEQQQQEPEPSRHRRARKHDDVDWEKTLRSLVGLDMSDLEPSRTRDLEPSRTSRTRDMEPSRTSRTRDLEPSRTSRTRDMEPSRTRRDVIDNFVVPKSTVSRSTLKNKSVQVDDDDDDSALINRLNRAVGAPGADYAGSARISGRAPVLGSIRSRHDLPLVHSHSPYAVKSPSRSRRF